jgi:hypothetical protein
LIELKSINIDEFFQTKLSFIFKRTDVRGTQAINRSKSVLGLSIYLHKSLPEINAKSVDGIWKLKGNPENTYKAYLFSLQFLSYLNNGFEAEGKIEILDRSTEIINSWLDFESLSEEKIIWYDFTVANRVIILTHYLNLCIENNYNFEQNFKEKLIKSLIKNGKFLSLEKNYKNNNHGIMMDRALLQLSLFFQSEDKYSRWKEIALDRLSIQIKSSFTNEYINVENSPEYHNHTYLLFKELYDFIEINQVKTNFGNLKNMIDNIYSNHLQMLKPDLSYPLIGDTNKHIFKEGKYIPESIVYERSGIGFLKSPESYMSIKSGFINTSHKHHDDLSFTYNFKGSDVFLDGGKYNYNNKDKFRKYIVSPHAHNTVMVNNSEYSLDLDSPENTQIVNYELSKSHGYVQLINNHYDNVEINRKVFNFYPNIILIVDNIKSDKRHLYSQIFNIHPHFNVKKMNSNGFLMFNNTNNTFVELTQYGSENSIEYGFGFIKEGKVEGFFSEEFDRVVPCHNIRFNSSQENHTYVTTIELKETAKVNDLEGGLTLLNYDEDNMIFTIKKPSSELALFTVNIESGKLIEISQLKQTNLKLNNACLSVSIEASGKNLEFACYILENNKITNKFKYQDSPNFNIDIEPSKKIEVWSFVRNKNNNTLKLISKENYLNSVYI